MKPIKTAKITAIHPFVSPGELEIAEKFSGELAELNAQRQEVCLPYLERQAGAAESAYLKQPTREHFLELRNAHVALAQYGIVSGTPMSGVIEAAVTRLQKRILDWVRPILERGLARAQTRYSEIEAGERSHHEAVTGDKLPPDPPDPPASANQLFGRPTTWKDSNLVLAAAHGPIEQLERMIGGSFTAAEVLRFLRGNAETAL